MLSDTNAIHVKNKKQTIKKIVGFLNNPEEDGGFWLPNIQRPFVWDEEQICRLFDSILREYPISTLLIWKTNSSILRRKFIDNWKSSLNLADFYVPTDDKKKCLVLDGQQRLQSMFIALCGSFDGKELYLDILSGEVAAPDDIKYRFEFLNADNAEFPKVKFKDLVFTTKKKRELATDYQTAAGRELTATEMDKVEDHIDLVFQTFRSDEAITYQELDSIDNPNLYTEDDVVEVFIRANSGGTKLGKSDLLFALLSATWDVADEQMNDLLQSLNQNGFGFDRDFVLKTCLVLLDKGAKYKVDKFREDGVREKIEQSWEEICDAIRAVLDFIRNKTFIQSGKALTSERVLIPLIYLRYHYPDAWKDAKEVDDFVLTCLLTGAFSSHTDNVINALVTEIKKSKSFSKEDLFGVIQGQNKSLSINEDRLFQIGYNKPTIHLLFSLWYHGFDYTPAYENNLPQIDHIFPQSAMKQIKVEDPETGKMKIKYSMPFRNQLANCMLLTREENGAGGKRDTLPKDWFADKDEAYLARHLIPADSELWELERFEDFLEARKALILQKFGRLVQ